MAVGVLLPRRPAEHEDRVVAILLTSASRRCAELRAGWVPPVQFDDSVKAAEVVRQADLLLRIVQG